MQHNDKVDARWLRFSLFPENLGEGAGDDAGVKELGELRDKYEGKLTASLYTGTLCVAVVASLIALGALCFTDYHVSIVKDFL